MANTNSKLGIILGISGAIAAVGIATYLIVKKSQNKAGTPKKVSSLVPTRPPSGATPPLASQQQGLGGIVKGLLESLGIGGKGKGGVSLGGGSGSSGGGGGVRGGSSSGGTKPTASSTSSNWNSSDKYDSSLGGYVQPTGDIYDKKGNYLGYLDDNGNFNQYDESIGGHIDQFGNITDMSGNSIGYIGDDGEVYFTQTLQDGTVVDTQTGDAWDANGNYLGFTNDEGNFVSYIDGEYIDEFGGVYDSSGELLGAYDEIGDFHYFGDSNDDYFAQYGGDEEYYGANGMQVKSNALSNTVVTANGRILNTRISKRNNNG